MLTSHIRCFVLVFTVFISAAHAIPTPLSSPPSQTVHARNDISYDRPFPTLTLKPFDVKKFDFDFDVEKLRQAHPYRLTIVDAFDSTTFPSVGTKARRGFTPTIRNLLGKDIFEGRGIQCTNERSNTDDLMSNDVIFVFEALDSEAAICGGVWACVGWRRESKTLGNFSSIYDIRPKKELWRFRHDGRPSWGSEAKRKAQGDSFHNEFWKDHRDIFQKAWPELKEAIEKQDLEQRHADRESINAHDRENWNKKHHPEKAGTNLPTPQTEAHTGETPGSIVTVSSSSSSSVHSNAEAVHGPPFADVPKSEWSKEFRATVLEYSLDVNEPPEFPSVGFSVKDAVNAAINTLLHVPVDHISFTNEPANEVSAIKPRGMKTRSGAKGDQKNRATKHKPSGGRPLTRQATGKKKASTEAKSAVNPKNMIIFVLEARSDNAVCGGEWPCIGWLRVDEDGFSSIYHIDPKVKKLRRIKHDRDGKMELGNKFDAELWVLCPRKNFQASWPLLKSAINLRYRERLEEFERVKGIAGVPIN